MKNKFIVFHKIGKDITWFVSEIRYEDFSDKFKYRGSDWILGCVESQHRQKAKIFFNKSKALKIAKILSEQVDEEGYSFQYEVLPTND